MSYFKTFAMFSPLKLLDGVLDFIGFSQFADPRRYNVKMFKKFKLKRNAVSENR